MSQRALGEKGVHRRTVRQALNCTTNENAALKGIYLAVMSLDPTGTGRKRWTSRWKQALQALGIAFDGQPNPTQPTNPVALKSLQSRTREPRAYVVLDRAPSLSTIPGRGCDPRDGDRLDHRAHGEPMAAGGSCARL